MHEQVGLEEGEAVRYPSLRMLCSSYGILSTGSFIFLGAHANETIVVDEQTERIAGGDQSVDSQIYVSKDSRST